MIRLTVTMLMSVAVALSVGCEVKEDGSSMNRNKRQELLQQLRSPDTDSRVKALKQLRGDQAPESVEAFLVSLTDPSPTVRDRAISALARSADPRASSEIAPLLGDSNDQVRRSACWALGSLKAVDQFEHLLVVLRNSSENVEVRCSAVGALGEIGDARAVDPLLSVVNDSTEDSRIRSDATCMLGTLGDPRAVTPLIALMLNPLEDYVIRDHAARTLGILKDTRALEALSRLAETSQRDSIVSPACAPNPSTLCEALADIGDPRAEEPLLHMLQSDEASALKALGRLGTEKGVARALSALTDRSIHLGTRIQVPEGIARGTNASAINRLVAILDDPTTDQSLREAIVRALAKSDMAEAYQAAIAALNDPNLFVRSAAAWTFAKGRGFGECGCFPPDRRLAAYADPQLIPALEELMNTDRRDSVRSNAATAIRRARGKLKEFE